MVRERKMAGERDKTDGEVEGDAEMLPAAQRQAAQVWGDVRRSLRTPVRCFMYYRYEVSQTSDVCVVLCFVLFSPPPPVPKWENDSLALGCLEGGRSICIGPSVNMRFLQVIS